MGHWSDGLEKMRAGHELVVWSRTQDSFTAAWAACGRGDWLAWLAWQARVDVRTLVRIACACARTALRYVPSCDDRPLRAIEIAERYGRGEHVAIADLQFAADLSSFASADASDAADAYATDDAYAAAVDAVGAAADAAKAAYDDARGFNYDAGAFAISAPVNAAGSYRCDASDAAFAQVRREHADIVRREVSAEMILAALPTLASEGR